ncbi:RNA polymerase II transcription mediator complex subunit 9-domain-containing protein [Aspergillus bertholletiae]|uniref:Mediator of RNA polymerase II transcription subunit 9 n=1 Tax=Aspergillus bertholletiae TaxID=1226010 RepID=A0A5N7BE50_9EURO|nr:RNA polymerase II transcription mediator complex subunit 9-domain-containing protein [Aspergillus bertholletiae]
MASRSPAAVTPLPKLSSAPQTPIVRDAMSAPPTAPQPVPFPPPQTFDIIPPLHGLLLRLLSPQANTEGVSNDTRAAEDPAATTAPTSATSTAAVQPQSHPQRHQSAAGSRSNDNHGAMPTATSAAPGSASAAAEIAALSSNAPPPLDIKDLPTEASSIKIRIQKAQVVVESLPDVHRSVVEQETEIKELEDRISRLKSVISDFGRRADPAKTGKVEIEGA